MNWLSKKVLTIWRRVVLGGPAAIHVLRSLAGVWATLLRWRRLPWCRERLCSGRDLAHRVLGEGYDCINGGREGIETRSTLRGLVKIPRNFPAPHSRRR